MTGFGSNLGYVDDLYQMFLENPANVSEAWQEFFADYQPLGGRRAPRGASPAPAPTPVPAGSAAAPAAATALEERPDRMVVTAESETRAAEQVEEDAPPADEYETMHGPAARLVENMETSLTVPTATSVRTIAVKLLDENRRILNQHLKATAQLKASYTHIIAYAIVKALARHPSMNDGFEVVEGKPHRVRRGGVSLGLAIDIERRGKRMLLVPNLKNAERLDFLEFLTGYNELVDRAREGKLGVDDFAGTSVTITNPGMIGTVLSVPRLMMGQGTIIGIGSIAYPSEFAGMSADALHQMGISKVMTVTSTYDHRVIQGAESGAFLRTVEECLFGQHNFYQEIFDAVQAPHIPFEWTGDGLPSFLDRRSTTAIAKEAQVLKLINAYRVRGHLLADLNPLGYEPVRHPDLDISAYGLSVWDLDREFVYDDLAGESGVRPLRSILDTLRSTYCGFMGVEYMFIADSERKRWLMEQLETIRNTDALDPDAQLRVLAKLNAAEAFERFLHTSYVGQKRFSLEGCETLIPVLDALLNEAGDVGVEEVVMGMAHRGRLNVLVNTFGKSLPQMFQEFEDVDPSSTDGSGDVKYHLGTSGVHETPSGKEVRIELASNPSHLESVNPVVEGIVRARQEKLGGDRRRVLPLLIHGDAAFAGQGVVAETLNMARLAGYRTGGTVHVIVNNQIGFTTSPVDARSTHYATDIAKSISAPILHVNADHPRAAVRAISIALAFRQQFQHDVVVDLICYRRWGHNEGDEPAYTQPLMYSKIRSMRSVRKLYTEQLLRQGDMDISTAEEMLTDFQSRLNEAMTEVRDLKEQLPEVQPLPDNEAIEGAARPPVPTGVDRSELEAVVDVLATAPDGFAVHPKLSRQLAGRRKSFDADRVDWALAESLAFGTLVREGRHVRLSGEDSGRGTFSQRHAVLFDQNTGERYISLRNVAPDQAKFGVYDSLLSEFAVMGFDYGYSVAYPESLVMWEAQFGDFANGAQVIVDQYISSAEEKWKQRSSLVLLLPHGYEGQGPEHSSARLERFLQLCAEGNMRIASPTTPAQYYHLLRRQVHAEEKKPLIVMTPKSLLRLPAAVSPVEDFEEGAFREVIPDTNGPEPRDTRRILFCNGRVYYDLVAERESRGANDIAIVRLEQFYPFAGEELTEMVNEYPEDTDLVWVQDEPRNMGGWDFIDERFNACFEDHSPVRYVGRAWSASPATGSLARHRAEQRQLFDEAFE